MPLLYVIDCYFITFRNTISKHIICMYEILKQLKNILIIDHMVFPSFTISSYSLGFD